jgi:hypothetical protein
MVVTAGMSELRKLIVNYYYNQTETCPTHIYHYRAGNFRQLKERLHGRKKVVDISICGVKKRIYVGKGKPKVLLTFNDVLRTAEEFDLWRKKTLRMDKEGREKFNKYAMRRFLRAAYSFRNNPEKRLKYLTRLFS